MLKTHYDRTNDSNPWLFNFEVLYTVLEVSKLKWKNWDTSHPIWRKDFVLFSTSCVSSIRFNRSKKSSSSQLAEHYICILKKVNVTVYVIVGDLHNKPLNL